MGILGSLAHRVGPRGTVVGLDQDAVQLAAARAHVAESGFANVEIVEADAYASALPDNSFDFVHVRFVFAPVGRDDALLAELLRLAKPGGIIGIEEPDTSSWSLYPPHPAWEALKAAILAAFKRGGGDLDAGRRMFGLLRRAGLEDVTLRAAVVALQDGHPHMRLPIQFATSLRARILDGGLMNDAALDAAVMECEQAIGARDSAALSYIVTQVSGRKPQ
ncbi:hypothetical protein GCM10011611_43900 [Aliidongia dinghuensis]|uniref:Methyltransferase domain-containing protein n=1 Tax=Aliidongia dinghuensis TaxID=1867774 RepID=A0A8J2YWN9_9PROT|nr:hypothetical protein GCM10011611_43900 [Aliidongia dinghuensis]